ncbi:MAG TPA: MFS transporter [Dehalococcoidia bacterium]|nr:MFS transporter [Dehalococcoidia bacterium]
MPVVVARDDTPVTAVSSKRRPRIFYGYWLVLVTFIFLFLTIGCGSFAFSLFVTPLQSELGWGRGEIMAGFTVFFVTMGIVSPVVGRFVDRYGARLVIPLGAVVMGLGFVIASRVSDLYLFYIGYFVIGAGAAGMGQVPSSAVVSHWFKRRRGTAIGFMAAGVGAGGLIAPFISYLIVNHGFRVAYLAMAIIIWAVVIPLGAIVVRTRPSEMGLYPDGAEAPPEPLDGVQPAPTLITGMTLREAARTRTFWLIVVSFFPSCFASMGLVQAPVPFLQDIGYPMATAATALSAVAIGSGLGKVFFGWLCDRVQPKKAWATGQALMAASVLILLNVRGDSPVILIWAYALLLGFGVGSWLPSLSMLASTNFGLLAYGAVFGALNLVQSLGTATGPFFAGVMYDTTGTYYWAFVTFGLLFAIGIPAILLVKKPARLHN